MAIKYSKICHSQRHLYHNSGKIELKFRKYNFITQSESHISHFYVLSTIQSYPKVLPSFTHAIIGKRWVKLGKTGWNVLPAQPYLRLLHCNRVLWWRRKLHFLPSTAIICTRTTFNTIQLNSLGWEPSGPKN